jgi:hypothetical protein
MFFRPIETDRMRWTGKRVPRHSEHFYGGTTTAVPPDVDKVTDVYPSRP